MEFEHRDGPDAAAGSISLGPTRDAVPIEDDGTFEVDDDRDDLEDVVERLEAAGHERVTDGADEDDVDDAVVQEDDEEEPLLASDFTEEELVEMGRDELRPIAASYDDINGNASGEKLTEELIKQRREEVEE